MGSCDKRFEAVRDALAESLRDRDVGASAAVFVDGEPVADLWGGYADAARAVPWQRDTVVNVYSVSKTMLALCALILADRGVLDLDAAVCRYWPEFAAAGKEDVLVRHVLAHTAGLPHLDGMVSEEDLYDWPGVTARLAVQAPRWKPGTQAGYHSLTQGFILGEVIRRVTGRRPGAFFAAEVAGPLGADFQFTLPMADDGRFAAGLAPPGAQADWRSSAPASAGNEAEGSAGSAAGTSAGRRGGVRRGLGGRRRPGRDTACRGQLPDMAADGDPVGQRVRQRPLGRRRPVGARLRRHGPGGTAAVAGGLRPGPP